MHELKKMYKNKAKEIKSRLDDFKNLKQDQYYKEFLFCLLTPQSNAKKCWQAVQELSKLENPTKKQIIKILKSKTRFHNNKSSYIINNADKWNNIKNIINSNKKTKELRNIIAEKVKGYGLKEASHFLRNIGKSNNEIAILDRHILKNLKYFGVIENNKIRNKQNYFDIENKFLDFSRQVNIPIDKLDLLFWSKENGEIFK